MQLYFTRHGKTQWNLEGRFQGREGDSPLLEESYAEIALLGEYLKEIPFAAIYTSSAKRAVDTAENLAKHLNTKVPIYALDELREFGFGQLEGRKFVEVNQEFPEASRMRDRLDLYDPSPFAGEKVGHMLRRMEETIVSACQRHLEEGPILFVGHGAAFSACIPWLSGQPLAQLRAKGGLKNSSLSILETTDGILPYQLSLWNDTHFLEK